MEPVADRTPAEPDATQGKGARLPAASSGDSVHGPDGSDADEAASHSLKEQEGDVMPESDAQTGKAAGSDNVEAVAAASPEPVGSPDADPPAAKKKTKKKKKAKAKGSKDASLDKTKAGAKKDPAAKFGTSRGIETMFRSNYRVHMDLSAIADTKANIMISINGLILPILLGAISPKIDSNPWLLIPTSVLMVGCLISMIFAIRSARPRVSREPVSLDQINQKGYNILFFGHFANMRRDDYEEGMAQLMSSNEDIYRNMIRDLHGLGSVLNEKYALLRTSYTVFMIAITVGVLLFIATFFLIAMGVISVPGDTLAVPYELLP
ncbi:MAG: Pycsar system effector family protein [Bacteroidota bacterium]